MPLDANLRWIGRKWRFLGFMRETAVGWPYELSVGVALSFCLLPCLTGIAYPQPVGEMLQAKLYSCVIPTIFISFFISCQTSFFAAGFRRR